MRSPICARSRAKASSEWCSRWITRVKVSVNAVRGPPSAGRQCALRCEVSMSDEHQTPQSAYHGADLALAVIKIKHRAAPDETGVIAAPEVRRIPDVRIVVR